MAELIPTPDELAYLATLRDKAKASADASGDASKNVRQGIVQAQTNHQFEGVIGFECLLLACAAGGYADAQGSANPLLIGIITFCALVGFTAAMARRQITAMILSTVIAVAWTSIPVVLEASAGWIVGVFLVALTTNIASLQCLNDYSRNRW